MGTLEVTARQLLLDTTDNMLEGLVTSSSVLSYHPALFLVAGPVFFLCLPYFSHSELRGGVVIWCVHQCGPLSLTDVGSVSLPTWSTSHIDKRMSPATTSTFTFPGQLEGKCTTTSATIFKLMTLIKLTTHKF
eukprot:1140406-Pelagomonas_calceolata.AAC.16